MKSRPGWFRYRGYSLSKDKDGWRWQITNEDNHKIILASTQGYSRRIDCIANIKQGALRLKQFAGMVK